MLCTLERWSPIQSCLKEEEEQDMQIIVFTPLSKQYMCFHHAKPCMRRAPALTLAKFCRRLFNVCQFAFCWWAFLQKWVVGYFRITSSKFW
jgi:hypothetical protein